MKSLMLMLTVTVGSLGGVMLYVAWAAADPAWPKPVLVVVGSMLMVLFIVLTWKVTRNEGS